MSRPAAMPRDPILDADYAEELLHASLRRHGWYDGPDSDGHVGLGADRQLYWVSSMLARAVVWVNHLRLAGLPSTRELHICGVLRDAVAARKTQLLAGQDPAYAEFEEQITAQAGPEKRRNRLPEWLADPPPGWSTE